MKWLKNKNSLIGSFPVLALVTGYMLVTAALDRAIAKEAGLDPAAKAQVESILRLHIGQSRSNISGLLNEMKSLEMDIEQQEKDIGQLLRTKNKSGLLQNIKDKTKKLKDKLIK